MTILIEQTSKHVVYFRLRPEAKYTSLIDDSNRTNITNMSWTYDYLGPIVKYISTLLNADSHKTNTANAS